MQVLLAEPRGFCAGVVRAIEIVQRGLERFGAPLYVRHEIVHNAHVVWSLEARGARFVEDLAEVPGGAVTVFSAHGVSRAVEREALARSLSVLDATCPLVGKVHQQARRFVAEGRTLVVIGHAGHAEVEGTLGQVDRRAHLVASAADVAGLAIADDAPVAYVTQTTLGVDDTRAIIAALKRRFDDLSGPETSDICYATQNRQNAVRAMAPHVDVLLVVGAANSSNSNRLVEIGREAGVPSHLLASGDDLDPGWVAGFATIGITAGASAPESQVQDVIAALRRLGPVKVSTLPGLQEKVEFRLPPSLADATVESVTESSATANVAAESRSTVLSL